MQTMTAFTVTLLMALAADAPHQATIVKNVIHLEPSGASFAIPEKWVIAHRPDRHTLHLSAKQLKLVEAGAGEWDTEYASIVNAALPFKHCSAHVGSEGWGKDAVSFADLQVRAYVGDWKVADVKRLFENEGLAAARTIAKEAKIHSDTSGKWERTRIEAPLHFGDYGGMANVEFYTQKFDDHTIVLVFMFAGRKPELVINTILASFKPG